MFNICSSCSLADWHAKYTEIDGVGAIRWYTDGCGEAAHSPILKLIEVYAWTQGRMCRRTMGLNAAGACVYTTPTACIRTCSTHH